MNSKNIGVLEVKSESRGTVQAVFSTFNQVDLDGDVTLPGAFKDGTAIPISAFGHKTWDGELPVGRGVIRTTNHEAILDGQFFMDSQTGRDTFTIIKEMGDLQEWSYGYRVDHSRPGTFEGKRVRFLEKLTVHEVSPVMRGAGVGTRTLVAKSGRRGLTASDRAFLSELRAGYVKRQREDREFLQKVWLKSLRYQTERQQFAIELRAARDRQLAYWYMPCEWDDVSDERLQGAGHMQRVTAKMLDIPLDDVPALMFFRPELNFEREDRKRYGASDIAFCTSEPVYGLYSEPSNIIYIRHNLELAHMCSIVAHEMAHATGADEESAVAYEQMWYEAFPNGN